MSRHGVRLAACALALAACVGGPPAPDWLVTAHGALAAHTAAWLAGRDGAAAQELALARREVARTGDAGQMARVELTACAARFASLLGDDCPGFAPLAADAGPAAGAYAAYLAGRWQGIDADLLPPAQRMVLRDATAAADGLGRIEDPLSRLVAAAALARAGRLPPAGIAVAIDTAAGQGWRRPLAAWLALDRDRLRAAGDEAGAQARQRRIDRVLGAPSAPR
ncbi:MAG: hypothetical protein HY778_16865 [Betaproteobacteria bacterium]|nr:hypothetical protein [Betaproteobacteria bacterium]